ncbi:hypothetical protein BDQ12DRAFT_736999 [Crucibulum laeve]|uniref:Vacuolar membrane-associated protein IML1 n=1 Tax=Crucibulum laeve TaxID=68775 RepID=A0A5C3LV14_9AGAR|nr:hypothetical protein BDQ12DRAFT_736999 [Crucibulum laeve]
MTTSRAESQVSGYGRRRSNTAQSILRPIPVLPLKIGDSKVLNSWVHDVKESATLIFNHVWWPGVAEGDLLRVLGSSSEDPQASFLFTVPKDDGCSKPQLQISIPKPIAEVFDLRNNGEVTVTKVDKDSCCADYVELIFQDQYLGRNDMWRLGEHLVGQCIYTDQEVSFIGGIAAKINRIYIDGKTVSSACMTSSTKAIYRSLSAKVTIFIQVCRELWEFAGDGERYNEKIVHSFLPALFAKWREAGTNHTVTIVLISRVFYDESEIDYAAGPLRRDERGRWYKDFYKVITDLEVIHEWKPTLVSLKNSFWDFQRDILLTHHYHRETLAPGIGPTMPVRLVGRISYAHDGPILEALNLGLNPTETHYIDRSLSLTGATTMLISPGTGYFRVSKQLLRLTTTRMLDQGFVLHLVLLTKPPLHQSPIFSFQGMEPATKPEKDEKFDPQTLDPLWGGDDDLVDERKKKTFWWEPFWISTTFWDKQMDLPFRHDRFIARAKMHEIQMLGLLEHDVLSSIEVPFLPDRKEDYPSVLPTQDTSNEKTLFKAAADKFDMDIFALKTQHALDPLPAPATISGPVPYRPTSERKNSHRNSIANTRITTIEESPRRIIKELPPEGPPGSLLGAPIEHSKSPSSSIKSGISGTSASSKATGARTPAKGTLASKLAPSWLFNPFRSGPSEPQTSQVSASASPRSSTPSSPSQSNNNHLANTPGSPIRMPIAAKATIAQSSQPRPVLPVPMAIKMSSSHSGSRSSLSRTFEEETLVPHRGSFIRRSPMSTPPPRDESSAAKRRSNASTLAQSYTSSSPGSYSNPSQPQLAVSYTQASMARRWQHILPQPLYKHDIKWKALITPGCLPLTVEHFPTASELVASFDVFNYDFVLDPQEMRSFLVKPPPLKGTSDDMRRAWALSVMRGMVAVRLAQGFQFVLRPHKNGRGEDKVVSRRHNKAFEEDDLMPKPIGASDILRSPDDPVYLSMTNEIHRILYTGDAIQVRRYVRRVSPTRSFDYQCLIWPKLGGGYTELSTTFSSHGLENYGWNRLDMLVAGYEHNFNESLRYWRTRFVIIPTDESPQVNVGPSGEKLNDEEARILGIEKLAEQFTKLRWQPPDERVNQPAPPVRFLPTTLDPAISVLDEALMDQLDQIHAAGPLKKKMKSEREIGEMSLSAIAKAMREEEGVPIKHYHWHRSQYPNSFIGFDFVSWLAREFRDVSSRTQGTEWGVKFLEQGLFEHVRGKHGFLDGHYFYRLKGEYSVPMTPKGWFRRYGPGDDVNHRSGYYPSSVPRTKAPARRNKKRLILSQTMVIDIDPNKRSDQAESVVLHHDIIHNPATVFHFELQWIGTTARCIEDQLRQWSRTIERYGLKLVEAYVTQISDIRDRNAFQSCFPLRLAVPPPIVPELEKRVPEGTHTSKYFEYALLRKFGFILDVEAAELYPEQVDVVYSYRRSPFKYSQFVHRSGVAFVQVLGGSQGFLFLTNRLMGPGRMGTTLKNKDYKPAAAAEEIRVQMHQFCEDKKQLEEFYDEQLALLPPVPEEPPPLSI